MPVEAPSRAQNTTAQQQEPFAELLQQAREFAISEGYTPGTHGYEEVSGRHFVESRRQDIAANPSQWESIA